MIFLTVVAGRCRHGVAAEAQQQQQQQQHKLRAIIEREYDYNSRYTNDEPKSCTWSSYHPSERICLHLEQDPWQINLETPKCRQVLHF